MSESYRYYNVPTPSDSPDVPRDFKRFADSQFNWTTAIANQATQPDVVSTGQGNVEIVGVDHPFAAGSLLLVSTSFWCGVINAVIGYFWIAQNGIAVSNGPTYTITGQPSGPQFVNQVLLISSGPGRFNSMVRMDVSAIQVQYRTINVQCLARG